MVDQVEGRVLAARVLLPRIEVEDVIYVLLDLRLAGLFRRGTAARRLAQRFQLLPEVAEELRDDASVLARELSGLQ